MRIPRFAVMIGFPVVLASCGEPFKPAFEPDDEPEVILEQVSAITGVVGELTEVPPTVRAKRQSDGSPVKGVVVAFGFTGQSQGGLISGSVDTTDALGLASAGSWRLGTRAGAQQLQASIYPTRTSVIVTATARATAPERFYNVSLLKQFVLNGREAAAPSLVAFDVYSNPVPGVDVTFSPAQDGGVVGRTLAKTNASGIASADTWKIPATVGSYSVTATVAARAFAFTAQRVDSSSLVWHSLDSIVGPSSAFLPGSWGIRTARLGLSPFDPCLCVNLDGIFVEITDYLTGSSTPSESGGEFTISGGKASLWAADSIKVTSTGVLLKRRDYYSPTFYSYVYNRKN